MWLPLLVYISFWKIGLGFRGRIYDLIRPRNSLTLSSPYKLFSVASQNSESPYSYPDHKVLPNFFLFSGTVQKGYGRGSRKLGFPTANLPQFENQLSKTSLEDGVYYGLAQVEQDTAVHYCVANIGYSPTFTGEENRQRIIETHLLDYDNKADFYNQNLKVLFIGFLRKEMKFPSIERLRETIEQDVMITRELFECLHDQGLLLSLQKQFFQSRQE